MSVMFKRLHQVMGTLGGFLAVLLTTSEFIFHPNSFNHINESGQADIPKACHFSPFPCVLIHFKKGNSIR